MNRLDYVQSAPLYESARYPDVKDPSPVFDGARWHLFGTGCGLDKGLEILHATARRLRGPWREERPSVLVGAHKVSSPAAPGVWFDGHHFHMFLQHVFDALGGDIEHLVSRDGGRTFVARDTALRALPNTAEAGIYDPDPAIIGGSRYLTYAGMSVVGEPELFLARCKGGSWNGPWERLGCILRHDDVAGHNQLGDEDYEWGLEGPQLLEMPDGRCLLTAVCFLSGHPRGERQRLLLAVADEPIGPYEVLGPVVDPAGAGENGHGSAVFADGELHVVFQERAGADAPWRYRRAALGKHLVCGARLVDDEAAEAVA
jgi:hypothetical protein